MDDMHTLKADDRRKPLLAAGDLEDGDDLDRAEALRDRRPATFTTSNAVASEGWRSRYFEQLGVDTGVHRRRLPSDYTVGGRGGRTSFAVECPVPLPEQTSAASDWCELGSM